MGRKPQKIDSARKKLLSGIGVPEQQEFKPDPFQSEAIESLHDGVDTLVIAPTGAGKTYIAVEAIRRVVEEGARAVYTAPLKALSNAKYTEFKKKFEPEHRVGLLTGDRKIEGDADIVVATTEIYRNELYNLKEQGTYSLVVLDEFHYLADSQRGPVWEESVILSARSSTLLMLSASISNAQQVADWIHDIRGREVRIVSIAERPVELRLAFLHPEHGVIPLENEQHEIFPEVKSFYADARSGRRGKGRDRKRFGGGKGRRRRGGKKGK